MIERCRAEKLRRFKRAALKRTWSTIKTEKEEVAPGDRACSCFDQQRHIKLPGLDYYVNALQWQSFTPYATQEISFIYDCTIININFCINIIIYLSLEKKTLIRTSSNSLVKCRKRLFVTVQGVIKSSFAWVEIAKQECAFSTIIDTLSGMGSR